MENPNGAFLFLKTFIIVFLTIIIIDATLNILVDPFFKRETRIEGFNNQFSEFPYWNTKVVVKLLSKENAEMSIIGTSNILLSINNCNYPEIDRIANSALSNEESAAIAIKKLTNDCCRSVFVEISSSEKEMGFNFRRISWNIKDVLGFEVTLKSIKTIAASFKNTEIVNQCSVIEFTPIIINNLKQLQSLADSIRFSTANDIAAFENADWEMVTPTKQPKKVVLFFSPIPKEILDIKSVAYKYEMNVQLYKALVERLNKTYNHIQFDFIDMTKLGVGSSFQFKYGNFYDGWYDKNHYKEVIGEEVLINLLNR